MNSVARENAAQALYETYMDLSVGLTIRPGWDNESAYARDIARAQVDAVVKALKADGFAVVRADLDQPTIERITKAFDYEQTKAERTSEDPQ